MKYEEEYTNLSNAIRWGNQSMLLNTLNKNSNLDLTYKEGKFFVLAVEDNNIKIIKPLLGYFNNNQLAKYKSGSIEYLLLKNKIRDILEVAVEDVSLSEEMKAILSLYIDFEGSENNDNFLENEHVDNNLILKDYVKSSTLKKSHSANDLHNSTFDNSKENLLTEDHLKRLNNNSSDEKFKFIEEFFGHPDIRDVKTDDLLQKDYNSGLAGNLHNTDEL